MNKFETRGGENKNRSAFLEAKDQAKGVIENGKDQTGYELDEGIKPLIVKLNSLPFLATIGSCEGHLRSTLRGEPRKSSAADIKVSSSGLVIYFPGNISMEVDGSGESIDFINDLRTIIARFPNATIEGGEKTGDGYYFINFDKDPENQQHKKHGVFHYSLAEAIERDQSGKLIIEEIEKLTDNYLGRR